MQEFDAVAEVHKLRSLAKEMQSDDTKFESLSKSFLTELNSLNAEQIHQLKLANSAIPLRNDEGKMFIADKRMQNLGVREIEVFHKTGLLSVDAWDFYIPPKTDGNAQASKEHRNMLGGKTLHEVEFTDLKKDLSK